MLVSLYQPTMISWGLLAEKVVSELTLDGQPSIFYGANPETYKTANFLSHLTPSCFSVKKIAQNAQKMYKWNPSIDTAYTIMDSLQRDQEGLVQQWANLYTTLVRVPKTHSVHFAFIFLISLLGVRNMWEEKGVLKINCQPSPHPTQWHLQLKQQKQNGKKEIVSLCPFCSVQRTAFQTRECVQQTHTALCWKRGARLLCPQDRSEDEL